MLAQVLTRFLKEQLHFFTRTNILVDCVSKLSSLFLLEKIDFLSFKQPPQQVPNWP
jgi:hypothetical protein